MQRKIIYSLLSIAIFLLFANIFIELLSNNDKAAYSSVTKANIEKKIKLVLKSFAIDEDWVSKIELKQPLDSAKYFWKIRLPKSIKQPVLLNEIEQAIIDLPLVLQASEESIGGNTILKIFHSSKVIYYGKLIYDSNIEREFSRVAFFVQTNSELDSIELAESKTFVPSVELLIALNENCNRIVNQSKRFQLHYSLLLDDDISDEYAMDENDSKAALIVSVKKIIREFSDSKNFIIDVNSDLYNSKIFPLIESEFRKRNIKLLKKQNYHNFLNKPFDEQISLLSYYCESNKSKDVQKIILSMRDLLQLKEKILNERLKGHQFVDACTDNLE